MKLYRLVAFAGLACLAPQILHAQPAAAPAAASAEVRLPHISIQSIGRGDPVVLIPGLASPRAVWDGIAPELARNHRVILVQVNGFGGDDPGANTGENILDGVVADLVRYFDQNRITRPAVIGHSMGGLIGMMLAKAHPERVGRLMIVDSLPFFGVLMGPNATLETVRPIAAQLRTALQGQSGPQPVPPSMSLTERGRALVGGWMNAANHHVTGQAIYEDATSDLRGDVPAIGRVPTTVLYAVSDPARAEMFRAIFAGAYAAAPSIRVVPVENSAHFIMLDQPDRFREAVIAFLGAG
jgi:pimeloyl-ACP methyl ester carboxylesterase